MLVCYVYGSYMVVDNVGCQFCDNVAGPYLLTYLLTYLLG